MIKATMKFFDKLEDGVRTRLSRYPLLYGLIGGVAIVLFWRGVWHLADDFGLSSVNSIVISAIILLSTGLFVSFFVGENIILTGLKHEKKLVEKEEAEIKTEGDDIVDIKSAMKELKKDLEEIKKAVTDKANN